jgi:GTPase SAR1 family protein
MSHQGYSRAKQQSDAMATTLRELATLIGEPSDRPVRLGSGDEIEPGLGLFSEARILLSQARDIEQGIFRVIVLGEFKNGKSTLLNAWLGKRLLAARATPTTAIINELVYGENDQVAIYRAHENEPLLMDWSRYNAEYSLSIDDIETLERQEYVDRFRDVEYARIECTHPLCANGVRLIDSPGLGEHVSRTRVTTNYLKQSQAVVLVLNATRILSQDERDFIETALGSARQDHVFFVVNFINRVAEDGPDEVERIKSWVRRALAPHFTRDGTLDDALCRRRIFYINALGALQARLAEPVDQAALEASGVPALETELETFLTGEEKIAAALGASAQLAAATVHDAQKRIAQQKASLAEPLAALEERRVDAATRLAALEERYAEIRRTIELSGRAIAHKVYNSLTNHLRQMRADWPRDCQTDITLDELNLSNIVKSFGSTQAKEKLNAAIGREVNRYLRQKLTTWSNDLPAVIQEDVEQMMAEVEAQVDDLTLELDRISDLFAGAEPRDMINVDERRGRKSLQLLLGIAAGGPLDLSQVSGTIMGEGDWGSFIGRTLQQVLTWLLVASLFSGPVALAVLLATEGVLILFQQEGYKQRLLAQMGTKLHQSLEEELAMQQHRIREIISGRFVDLSDRLTLALQEEIAEVNAEQERIIEQKRQAGFSIELEQARLDRIGTLVQERLTDVTRIAFGRPLTPAQVDSLRPSRRPMAAG